MADKLQGTSGRGSRRGPSLRGNLMVDICNGQVRVRSWPRARGTPKSETTRQQNDDFLQMNWACKYQAAPFQTSIREAVEGTPLMPRDLAISVMAGRAFSITLEDGRTIYSMAAVRDVSGSLDVLGQVPGDMLYRGETFWERIPAGAAGRLLMSNGPDVAPSWSVGEGLTGAWVLLLDQTISGSTAPLPVYDMDDYSECFVQMDDVTLIGSGVRWVQVSVDGGATWKGTTSDYQIVSGAGTLTGSTFWGSHTTNSGSARSLWLHCPNLTTNTPYSLHNNGITRFVGGAGARINAIRAGGSVNMSGGRVRIWGR